MGEGGFIAERTPTGNLHVLGLAAALLGVGCLLAYPLTVMGVVPWSKEAPPGRPYPTHPLLIYFGVVTGSILLTWGTSSVRGGTVRPLTPRRALVAVLSSVVTLAVGLAVFTYRWAGTPRIDLEGNVLPPLDLAQIVQLELQSIQFVALAGVSALYVGTKAARDGWRPTLASAALPVGLFALGVVWPPLPRGPGVAAIMTVLAVGPSAVGYAAARRDAPGGASRDE